MVALVVEDGTGRSDANAAISLVELKQYCDDRGKSYSAFADEALNEAIVRSSAFLVNAYIWDGQKINRRLQTMPFPRYSCTDREGWPILPTEIPQEYKDACSELTLAEATTPGTMTPSVVLSDKVRTEQIGTIRVEYANLFNAASDARPVLTIVQDLLWPFLGNGGIPNPLNGGSGR